MLHMRHPMSPCAGRKLRSQGDKPPAPTDGPEVQSPDPTPSPLESPTGAPNPFPGAAVSAPPRHRREPHSFPVRSQC